MFYDLRLRIALLLPWRTKFELRQDLQQAEAERDNIASGAQYLRKAVDVLSEERNGERSGRLKLETQRIEEHEALRRMTFALAHGLEGTLNTLNEFITELPTYTADQSQRLEVFQGLTRHELEAEEQV